MSFILEHVTPRNTIDSIEETPYRNDEDGVAEEQTEDTEYVIVSDNIFIGPMYVSS